MEDKNSQQCYFAWENLQRGFCYCSYSSFHFCIFNLFLIFICRFSSFICFSTSSFTLPWTITGFLHPCYTFKSSPSQSDHFQPFRYLLTASATVLSDYFLPTGVFCLALLHRHFTCAYQGFPGSKEFFLEVCRTSCRSSNTDLVHLFV